VGKRIDGGHVKSLPVTQCGRAGRVAEPQPQPDARRYQRRCVNRARQQEGEAFQPALQNIAVGGSARGDPLPHFRLEARGRNHLGLPRLEV